MKARKFIANVFVAIVVSLALTVLYYAVFSLFFSTDIEKELIRENRVYSSELPRVEMAADMVGDVLGLLQMRDENIYRQVFKAELPDVENMLAGKPADALASAASIERSWRDIFDTLSVRNSIPPMRLPVDGLEYMNVGASIGERMNPFYKVKVHHDGLDMVAVDGTPVRATAAGYVSSVQTSKGGKGNMVEITHPNGYVTRYAHLLRATVQKGQRVRLGEIVGYVGDSGRAFTTHLHYEVFHRGEVLDPVHFFFGSLTPVEYSNFLVMSMSSGQSMD